MTEYAEGMRLRCIKHPDMGEGTIRVFSTAHNMWVFEFDTPFPLHPFWRTHTCGMRLSEMTGRFFYEAEFKTYFEVAGPKVRKLTGFARFVLDKSL